MENDKKIRLTISYTSDNKREKYLQAVSELSKSMKIPVTYKQRTDTGNQKGEASAYKSYEDLVTNWGYFYGGLLDQVYETLCRVLDLPRITTFSKARDSAPLIYKGKILYSPETGVPITKKQWKALTDSIETFLNKNLEDAAERLVLDATALGKILDRMLKFNTWEAISGSRLHELNYKDFGIDKYADKTAIVKYFDLPEYEKIRLGVARDYCAENITAIKDDTRTAIKKTFLNGIKERQSKGEVAQVLFDKFGSLNKDWQRVVETETSDIFNNSMLLADRESAPEGEPLYFQRMEILDDVTCPHCERIDGLVARWSDVPLDDENITDLYAKIAIWQGKSRIGKTAKDKWVASGSQHPYCRGTWTKWEAPAKTGSRVNAAIAKMKNRNEQWGKACRQAKQEFVSMGVQDANDATPGYLDRINEIFNAGGSE